MNEQQNRETFAAFVKKNLGDVAVMDNGRYISPKINNYWLLWEESRQRHSAQPAVPPMHASGLVAIKALLSRDPCAHAKVAIEMIDAMLTAKLEKGNTP